MEVLFYFAITVLDTVSEKQNSSVVCKPPWWLIASTMKVMFCLGLFVCKQRFANNHG